MTFAEIAWILQIVTVLVAVALGCLLGFHLGRIAERRKIWGKLKRQQLEQAAAAKSAPSDPATEWSMTLERAREAIKEVMRPLAAYRKDNTSGPLRTAA